jgi:hypothetical protein
MSETITEEIEDVKEETEASAVEENVPGWGDEPEAESTEPTDETEEESEDEVSEDEGVTEPESEEEETEKQEEMVPKAVLLKRLRKEKEKREQDVQEAVRKALADTKPNKESAKVEDQGYPEPPELTYDAETDRNNQAKYQQDLVKIELDKREAKAKATNEAKEKADFQEELGKKWEVYIEEDPEYAQILTDKINNEEDPVAVSQEVINIIHSEGFHVDKYIQQNPDKFLNKSPSIQILEVGKYLATKETKPSSKPVKKKKSKAPPPIKSVSKSGNSPVEDWNGWK